MKINDLVDCMKQHAISYDGATWHAVRPATYENTFLIPRIKAAWRVFVGKADVLDWDEQ